MKKITVVGAGFSGLVAAWRLEKEGFAVTVVEKAQRSGGMIEARVHPRGIIETAANGLLASKMVEELFADVGVEIQTPRKQARRRYLAIHDRISRFPFSIAEAFGLIVALLRARKLPPAVGEILEAWGHRTLGASVTGKLLGPAMLGIYATDAADLSANLIVGKFFDSAKPRNVRGRRRGTVSAPGGLETVLKAIRLKLEERGVRFTSNLDSLEGAPKVLAVPAWEAAKLLKRLLPSDRRIDLLEEIDAIPLISVTMFFHAKPPKLGFGTLFAQTADFGVRDGILGCLQNSEIFEGRAVQGTHSETWIVGGYVKGAEILRRTDEEIVTLILQKRDRLIDANSRTKLVDAVVTRWPQAIPRYGVELESALPTLQKPRDGVLLFGNYLGELGLASILESTNRLVRDVQELK